MNEKMITKAQYDEAVAAVLANEANDPSLQGMGKFLIPMVGAIFAGKIGALLFSEGDTNNG